MTSRDGGPADFCCPGCAHVHALLESAGLGRFYDLRDKPLVPVTLKLESDPEMRWLEDVERAVAAEAVSTEERATTAVRHFHIQGISCAACTWLIEQLFSRRAGGYDFELNPVMGRLAIRFDPRTFPLRAFVLDLHGFGYALTPGDAAPPARSSRLLLKLGLAGALAMNSMVVAFSFYFGLGEEEPLLYRFFLEYNLLLGTLSVVFCGAHFFAHSFEALRRRVFTLDHSISLGILLTFGASLWQHFFGDPRYTYFDSLAAFIFFMLLGRWLAEHHVERNRHALLAEDPLGGARVQVRRGTVLVSLAPAEVRAGDELLLQRGDLVPSTARLVSPAAEFRLDWITGEGDPVLFRAPATLPAGAIVAQHTAVLVQATADFAAGGLAQLFTERTEMKRGAQLVDGYARLTRWYLLGTFIVCAVGAGSWLGRDPATALRVLTTLLMVTCPCAIGISLPLAFELTVGRLRARGVYLQNALGLFDALEIRHVLFDKTGTLTLTRPRLDDDGRLAALDVLDRDTLFNMAARSFHPVSRAVAETLSSLGAVFDPAFETKGELREVPGEGLTWTAAGSTWRLGRDPGGVDPHAGPDSADRVQRGRTLLTRDDQVLAALAPAEALRVDAGSEIEALRRDGLTITILSGDAPERVRAAAKALGLPPDAARGGLSPADKEAFVHSLPERSVLMVGDGLNDLPAFRAAHLKAAPVTDRVFLVQEADLSFAGEGLQGIRGFLAEARRFARIERATITLALLYNAVVIAFAVANRLDPYAVAVLMPANSLVFIAGVTLATKSRF